MRRPTMTSRTKRIQNRAKRVGHTLTEMIVATAASALLLGGLGAVMMIGRQVAYAPVAAVKRTEAAEVIHQIAGELRYATHLMQQQTPYSLEFVVADRDADGTAERIVYQWSGSPGDPLYRTYNGVASEMLDSVDEFTLSFQQKTEATTLTTTVDTAETLLASNAMITSTSDRKIDINNYLAQLIEPANFTGVPTGTLWWNATKVDFYGSDDGPANEILQVQLRPAGTPNELIPGNVLAQVDIPESVINNTKPWNSATFAAPARGLGFHRRYMVVWLQPSGGGNALKFHCNTSTSSGVYQSSNAGASWSFLPNWGIHYRLYGTYTTVGPSYELTRTYVSHVNLKLHCGGNSHSRIDASVPLVNLPELLSAHWRTDFDRSPTTVNANGDEVADWAWNGSGTFDATRVSNGIWNASSGGALETRPLNDFTNTTIINVRCRNTTVGGNGAVMRINADRQGGQHCPFLVYVQRQSDGTQNLSLIRKPSDTTNQTLFMRQRLPGDFVRYQLIIVPQSNVVNLRINDEDQGTFPYSTYATTTPDRFVTLYADTSTAEFDYIDVRVTAN